MSIKLVILDDYQQVSLDSADWDLLGDEVEISVFYKHLGHSEGKVVSALYPFDIIVCMRERTRFPSSVLCKLANLKLLVTTGLRNLAIDMGAARAAGIKVCGTEMLGYPAAEHTLALIFDLFKKISRENRFMHEGGWQGYVSEGLNGKTLGLLGLGKLGSRVSKVARALEMEVVAWSANLTKDRCNELKVRLVDKETIFRISDIISVHLVLSERTSGLVGREELSLMKKSAYIVNTSRGPIVEETALVKALLDGSIAGAGLDVFEVEPLPVDHPLRKMDNVVLTGHTGYVIRELWSKAYGQALENILAWRAGKPLRILNEE